VTNITVISMYAPTMDTTDQSKDDFYDALQTATSSVPNGDIIIIAGDWNARTGPGDNLARPILGKYALGTRCLNGERLLNFASSNRCIVTNTRFQLPLHHLITWYSNDVVTKHQLDHMLIRSRWASCILDCRPYRGAETGQEHGSDHTIVRAKLRFRLKDSRPKPLPPMLDISKL